MIQFQTRCKGRDELWQYIHIHNCVYNSSLVQGKGALGGGGGLVVSRSSDKFRTKSCNVWGQNKYVICLDINEQVNPGSKIWPTNVRSILKPYCEHYKCLYFFERGVMPLYEEAGHHHIGQCREAACLITDHVTKWLPHLQIESNQVHAWYM